MNAHVFDNSMLVAGDAVIYSRRVATEFRRVPDGMTIDESVHPVVKTSAGNLVLCDILEVHRANGCGGYEERIVKFNDIQEFYNRGD